MITQAPSLIFSQHFMLGSVHAVAMDGQVVVGSGGGSQAD